jgi:hypothetical protein
MECVEENIWTGDRDRIRGWRKLHPEELHNIHSLRNIMYLNKEG